MKLQHEMYEDIKHITTTSTTTALLLLVLLVLLLVLKQIKYGRNFLHIYRIEPLLNDKLMHPLD